MTDNFGEGVVNDYEQQFTKIEIQVINISRKMSIFMLDLDRKFGPFGDFGGSNSNIGLEGKSCQV